MNEEENDIRYFINLIEDNKTHNYEYRKYYTPIFDKRLENILNLISKLQNENKELSEKMIDKICKGIEEEVLEEYREKIEKLQKEVDELDKENQRQAELLGNIHNKYRKELDKKDKIINLIAEDRAEISEPKVSKEAIIDYYLKKVEVENE